MKRISYAGGSLLTGDAIADALLDLAAALANGGRALRIDIPVMDLDDRRTEISLVIGPASQLAGQHVEQGLDVIDDGFVANARRIIDSLTEITPLPFTATQGPNAFT